MIYLTISLANNCHYCVAAHSTIAKKQAKAPGIIIEAIKAGQPIPDEKLQALVVFTRHVVQMQGWVKKQSAHDFLAAGFTEIQILSVILAVGVKTLSNYTNHVANTPIDDVFSH